MISFITPSLNSGQYFICSAVGLLAYEHNSTDIIMLCGHTVKMSVPYYMVRRDWICMMNLLVV